MTVRGNRRRSGSERAEVELGEALKGLLRSTGIHALMKHPELHAAWETAAGPDVAARSRIWAFRHGALEIAVESPALRSDLEFRRTALLQEIRRLVSKPFVEKMTFVVKPTRDDDDTRRQPGRNT